MRYYKEERPCIDLFREEYEFLSNFYPAKMEFEGITYYSAEAAYQAQKCKNPEEKIRFANMYADQAKRYGRKVEVRKDWDDIKIDVMRRVVTEKFLQHPRLAVRLVETGDKPLKEGNYRHNVFWGVDYRTGEGENHLGKILMELRTKYKAEGIPKGEKEHSVKVFGPVDGIMIIDEDITQLDVECIVNAANKTLLGGGGVDGAIHREAGPGLKEECRTLNGCETGEAKITGGYHLKAKYVIHTVGPIYGKDDDSLLECCYLNCLDLAKTHGIHSIAFPAISTGKYCFPKKIAMEIAIGTVKKWIENNKDYELQVIFSFVDQNIYKYACEYVYEWLM